MLGLIDSPPGAVDNYLKERYLKDKKSKVAAPKVSAQQSAEMIPAKENAKIKGSSKFSTKQEPVMNATTSNPLFDATTPAADAATSAASNVEMSAVTGFKLSDIGKRVSVTTKNLSAMGVLKFTGQHHDPDKGERIGVALDEPVGKNDGSLADGKHVYFRCTKPHGIIVMPKFATFEVSSMSSVDSPRQEAKLSSASDGGEEPRVVVRLKKQEGRRLGLGIDETPNGLIIRSVKEGGLASEAGGIKRGMRIVSVNGTDTTSSTKAECLALVKAVPQTVKFGLEGIGYDDPISPTPSEGASGDQLRKSAKESSSSLVMAPLAVPETRVGQDKYDTMGKLAVMKLLRSRGVDFSNPAGGGTRPVEELRTLARQSDAPANPFAAPAAAPAQANPFAAPAAAPAQTNPFAVPAAAPAPAPAISGGEDFSGWGKLKLIKLLRDKGMDRDAYAGLDVEQLRTFAQKA